MIIGLTGKMGTGKDTVADWLVENHEFKKVGFSDELYRGVCGLFDLTLEEALAWKDLDYDIRVEITSRNKSQLGPSGLRIEHGEFTWREFLQRFGTEMGRQVWGEDFWVERFEDRYLEEPERLVVRDVRFNNEAELIGAYGGTVWQILRPGYDGDGHESEAGIKQRFIDGDIMNDATIEQLHEMLGWWMEELVNG